MILPFTREAFLQVFTQYNAFAWPVSILAYALAALAMVALVWQWRHASRLIFAALAFMWAWTGIVYHMSFFSTINGAAWGFGALFLIAAARFAWESLRGSNWQAAAPASWTTALGWLFIAYATIAYPFIGMALAHRYMDLPQFGVTPCPVTLFTFGTLLLLRGPLPWTVLAAPLAWSLIGGTATFLLAVPQDWLLLLSGPLTVVAVLSTRRTRA